MTTQDYDLAPPAAVRLNKRRPMMEWDIIEQEHRQRKELNHGKFQQAKAVKVSRQRRC